MAQNTKRIALIVLALALPAVLAAQSGDTVLAEVEKRFADEKIPLRVELDGSVATLSGKARNVFVQRRAIEILLEQEGVETVETDVEIAEAESEQALGKEIVTQIRMYPQLTVFDDAGAMVNNGSVVLLGFVTEPFKKQRLENQLKDVIGIQEFDNQIQVLPNSMQDNNLRRRVFNSLYGDSMFAQLGRLALPPIRIIVQNARVILAGVAQNQMAKQRAAQIVRTTPGVLSVENRLRVGS